MRSRLRRRPLLVVLALSIAACGGGETGSPDAAPDPVAAAETICPLLWGWVTGVGDAFNRAAADVASIDAAQTRRDRWADFLAEVHELNDQLLVDIEPYAEDPILGPLVAEIERDVPLAETEVEDIRALFTDTPEIDEGRHQDRTVQVIVRIEKVIDLPKPDLGELDVDGSLLPAFRQVSSCQHAIRDVDNGSAEAE